MWAIKEKVKIIKVKGLRKYLGMMFQFNPAILSFDFETPTNISIHSAFCRKFFAIWLDDKNNIIEIKLVKPFRYNIKPKKKFSKLIEIPFSLETFP